MQKIKIPLKINYFLRIESILPLRWFYYYNKNSLILNLSRLSQTLVTKGIESMAGINTEMYL